MAEPQKYAFLAGSFFDVPLIESEQTRIAGLAESDGAPAHILRTYVPGLKPYKEIFQKKERIAGFRPGTPAYDKQAMIRLIRYLGQPTTRNYEFYWKFYKEAFYAFVGAELPKIKELLINVATTARVEDPTNFLTLICDNAFEYEVSRDDVRKFYEAWWLPRVETFETILQRCDVQDESKAQKRKLKRLEENFDGVQKSQAALDARTAEMAEELQKISKVVADQQETLQSFKDGISEVSGALGTLKKLAENQGTLSQKELTGALSGINTRLKAIEEAVGQKLDQKSLRAELKKSDDESKTAAGKVRKELNDSIAKTLDEKLSGFRNDLEEKVIAAIKAHGGRGGKPAVTLPPPTGYRSPLVSLPPAQKIASKINTEVEFANAWMTMLNRKYGVLASFEQILAHHALLASSSVAVVKDLALVNAWLECLGWNHLALQLAASPMWASESDWRDGLDYLLQDSGEGPRIVIIHNYDVAMVECYLAPTLQLWSQRSQEAALSKLLLVPSDSTRSPRSEILEHAPVISASDFTSMQSPQTSGIATPPTLRAEPPCGVDPKTYMKWIEHTSKLRYEFTTIQNSLGLELSTAVANSYSRILRKVGAHFTEPSAIGIGMTALILPWVKAKHGDSAYSSLGELLKQLPDVRC